MHLVSLPQVLVRWAAEAPERPARAPEGRTLTRGEFHRPANRLACVHPLQGLFAP